MAKLPKKNLQMRRFRFSPTLLDTVQHYFKETLLFDGTPMVDEDEVIRRLNRVKSPPSLPMLKGIAFEECIMRDVESWPIYPDDESRQDERVHVTPEMQAWFQTFVKGGIWQTWLEFKLPVGGDVVTIGGFSDCINRNAINDIKTTSRYDWAKYKDSFQHRCYLLGANNQGIKIRLFRYLVSNFREVFKEEYTYEPIRFMREVQDICAHTIAFIDQFPDRITDARTLCLEETA